MIEMIPLSYLAYETNKQKCIEANAKAYKRKPVYKKASQKRKEAKQDKFEIDFAIF